MCKGDHAMSYTVGQLAKMSGVSVRTLHHYDQIGLLCPSQRSQAGYRLYGKEQVARMQQILFYRELGLSLQQLHAALDAPDFDERQTLLRHREALQQRKQRLDTLIGNIDRTLSVLEGETQMSDQQRLEGFGQKLVEQNERSYGKEIREKYGDQAVQRSNAKVAAMSKEQWSALEQRRVAHYDAFAAAMPQGATSPQAMQAAQAYVQYLSEFGEYPSQAIYGLADLYVQDQRFTQHFEAHTPGLAAFVRDALHAYVKSVDTQSL